MILRFMTRPDEYGLRYYLALDTNAKIFSIHYPRKLTDVITVSKTALQNIYNDAKTEDYKWGYI